MSVQFIDPRGPRFGAGITSVLSLGTFAAAIGAVFNAAGAFVLMAVLLTSFLWSVFSPATHPYQLIFKNLLDPDSKNPLGLRTRGLPSLLKRLDSVLRFWAALESHLGA